MQQVACISPQMPTVKFSGNLQVSLYHYGSLKLAILGVFMPWKLTHTKKQSTFHTPVSQLLNVYQHSSVCVLFQTVCTKEIQVFNFFLLSFSFLHKMKSNYFALQKMIQYYSKYIFLCQCTQIHMNFRSKNRQLVVLKNFFWTILIRQLLYYLS